MSFTDWLKGQNKKGLTPDPTDNRNLQDQLGGYYNSYININKTSAEPANASSRTTTLVPGIQPMYTNSTTVGTFTTGTSWDNWTKEEKKALAKVGFKYDKKANEWILDLSATIRIPQQEGYQMLVSPDAGEKPSKQMMIKLKQLKEMIVEKITAKIILAELTKPREI